MQNSMTGPYVALQHNSAAMQYNRQQSCRKWCQRAHPVARFRALPSLAA
jgi:hypothetical protein